MNIHGHGSVSTTFDVTRTDYLTSHEYRVTFDASSSNNTSYPSRISVNLNDVEIGQVSSLILGPAFTSYGFNTNSVNIGIDTIKLVVITAYDEGDVSVRNLSVSQVI